MDAQLSEALEEMPPSAKLVFKVLEWNGELTQKRIAEKSMLSTRTVRFALNRLEENDVVERRIYFQDARKRIYSLSDSERSEIPMQP